MEFVLIDGEFRTLIRNGLERIIGENTEKQKGAYMDIANKLAIRVVSALISIHLYNILIKQPFIKEYTTYFFVFLFIALNIFNLKFSQ